MQANRGCYSLRALCTALQVSRSGYYAWCDRDKSPCPLNQAIERQFKQDKARAGAPSIAHALQQTGMVCSIRTVGRRMQRLGLRARYAKKFKRTTDSRHSHAVVPNHLARQFVVGAPNRVWVGDITYIPTREGWLYLAAVIDAFSRKVVGWSMSERITEKVAIDAMEQAVGREGPPDDGSLVFHDDQGAQYTSRSFQRCLDSHGIVQSVSRPGTPLDNAVAESFFKTLKRELVKERSYGTRDEAKQDIFKYIELYYNRVRMHSTLGYMSPVEYERQYA